MSSGGVNINSQVPQVKLVPYERNVVGFNLLRQFYDREIICRMGVESTLVDKQALIMGEVLLLCGSHREPNQPVLRDFLAEYLPTEVKEYILNRFNQLAFGILETAQINQDGVIRVKAIGGYALAIDSMRLQRV